jgi:hypothetical protein
MNKNTHLLFTLWELDTPTCSLFCEN